MKILALNDFLVSNNAQFSSFKVDQICNVHSLGYKEFRSVGIFLISFGVLSYKLYIFL
jgi:hypothetical protein